MWSWKSVNNCHHQSHTITGGRANMWEGHSSKRKSQEGEKWTQVESASLQYLHLHLQINSNLQIKNFEQSMRVDLFKIQKLVCKLSLPVQIWSYYRLLMKSFAAHGHVLMITIIQSHDHWLIAHSTWARHGVRERKWRAGSGEAALNLKSFKLLLKLWNYCQHLSLITFSLSLSSLYTESSSKQFELKQNSVFFNFNFKKLYFTSFT